MDPIDWFSLFFSFQNENVRNHQEHLVLHVANAQIRLSLPLDNINLLEPSIFRSFLSIKPSLSLSSCPSSDDHRRELLYVPLYLLIWGEAANLRFLPECICYIFHHMAMELNSILYNNHDYDTQQHHLLSETSFLDRVVKPIYQTFTEVERSRSRIVPHCEWRNYDDVNEYFWSKRCFVMLKLPNDVGSNFLSYNKDVGKTGFVEKRDAMRVGFCGDNRD
ncbi:hypothetical protein RJT34_14576 [Clitoria ternatea]|uniref:1,3-beta-glucan synthase component FKS1-like domain-containing protein n=1 Tax=Clitoria ternatea TaxID=43366 RepID=A0AAN9PMS7_CLITE